MSVCAPAPHHNLPSRHQHSHQEREPSLDSQIQGSTIDMYLFGGTSLIRINPTAQAPVQINCNTFRQLPTLDTRCWLSARLAGCQRVSLAVFVCRWLSARLVGCRHLIGCRRVSLAVGAPGRPGWLSTHLAGCRRVLLAVGAFSWLPARDVGCRRISLAVSASGRLSARLAGCRRACL